MGRREPSGDTPSGNDAFFVYVLGCREKLRRLTYVGWTTDPTRRLDQHNAGSGARFTRGRTWILLHCERHATMRAAMSREWHLKRDRAFRRRLAQAMMAIRPHHA